MKRVAIVISGGGSNMVKLVQAMQDRNFAAPVLVVSNRPAAQGLQKAHEMGVATAIVDHTAFADRDAFEADLIRVLEEAEPDIICLAGFMRILSSGFVERWAGKILNIHPSLLPKFKGLDTHARALDAGVSEAGCTVHVVTAELDDGPILGQARVPILKGDTPESLAARVLVQEHVLYPMVLETFAKGEISPINLPA